MKCQHIALNVKLNRVVQTIKQRTFLLQQLHGFIRAAVKRNAVPDVTVINDLEDLLKVVRGTLDDIEFRIICPLLQIHRHCETDGQHEVGPEGCILSLNP